MDIKKISDSELSEYGFNVHEEIAMMQQRLNQAAQLLQQIRVEIRDRKTTEIKKKNESQVSKTKKKE